VMQSISPRGSVKLMFCSAGAPSKLMEMLRNSIQTHLYRFELNPFGRQTERLVKTRVRGLLGGSLGPRHYGFLRLRGGLGFGRDAARQPVRGDHIVIFEDHRPLDHVAQLAHVAGPPEAAENLRHFGRYPADALP